jgi:hypothetical protein
MLIKIAVRNLKNDYITEISQLVEDLINIKIRKGWLKRLDLVNLDYVDY